MSAVCLVDTSVLCEILKVPGKHQDHQQHLAELQRRTGRGETLLLPMATNLETGNHIGQMRQGGLRFTTAERFVKLVQQAIDGQIPFTPTPFFQPEQLQAWLAEFPSWASRGSGFGDLSIKKEWDRQVRLHPRRMHRGPLDDLVALQALHGTSTWGSEPMEGLMVRARGEVPRAKWVWSGFTRSERPGRETNRRA